MNKFLNTRIRDMKAITLIALVITIVVLIILAAVAINLSLGSNGIFNRAKTGKEMYQNAEKYDSEEIAKSSNSIDSLINTREGGISEERLYQLLHPNKTLSLSNSVTGFSDATAEQSYTIDRDGWLYVYSARNAIGGWFKLTINSNDRFTQNSGVASNGASSFFPVKKGDVLKKTQSHTGFYWTITLNYFE